MPDTLCRRCGAELKTQTKCVECFQTIREICPSCQYTPLEKFHLNCMVMSGVPYPTGKKLQEVLAV
ncbi:MAG: hypothetical protein H2B05_03150 [Nitrosopumilaceae archaeon]|uniref:Uncharacterized protein n=1 Tax=Candidatus Nitrosomaritimum aestuariumsis TaxID=3342354 RepID=A0AC60W2R7_9ARCH|nr:hypothetical protein [Nitrosopumilaceae archaeon]